MERMKETKQTEVVVETTKTEVVKETKETEVMMETQETEVMKETKKTEVMMGLEFGSGFAIGFSFSLVWQSDLKAHPVSSSFSFLLSFSVS